MPERKEKYIEFDQNTCLGVVKKETSGYEIIALAGKNSMKGWIEAQIVEFIEYKVYYVPDWRISPQWEGKPKWDILRTDTGYDNTVTHFTFSSGTSLNSYLIDHYYVVILFPDYDTDLTEFSYEFLDNYYDQCEELFHVLTKQAVPQLLISLAVEIPKMLNEIIIGKILAHLQDDKWSKLQIYRTMVQDRSFIEVNPYNTERLELLKKLDNDTVEWEKDRY